MLLKLSCMQCTDGNGKPNGSDYYVEYCDAKACVLKCVNGHESHILLQNWKFEILFESGLWAISDRYYREAVFSFAACLERFYEFCIRILLLESTESDNIFQDLWKTVSSQSERQLGAFLAVWASRFNGVPLLMPDKSIKLRNRVVHKGFVPDENSAIDFGEAVLDVIWPLQAKILATCSRDFMTKASFFNLRDRYFAWNVNASNTTIGYSFMISPQTGRQSVRVPIREYLRSVPFQLQKQSR